VPDAERSPDARPPQHRTLLWRRPASVSRRFVNRHHFPSTEESLGATIDARPTTSIARQRGTRRVPPLARYAATRNARRRSGFRPSCQLADELAWLEALDTGKSVQAMSHDVELSAETYGLFRGARHRDQGNTIPINAAR
jgi:hypothetical protein